MSETIEDTCAVGDNPMLVVEGEVGDVVVESAPGNTIGVRSMLEHPERLDYEVRQEGGAIFACEVADWNPRSHRAFEKAGFERYQFVPQPPPDPSGNSYDLMLDRDRFDRLYEAS